MQLQRPNSKKMSSAAIASAKRAWRAGNMGFSAACSIGVISTRPSDIESSLTGARANLRFSLL